MKYHIDVHTYMKYHNFEEILMAFPCTKKLLIFHLMQTLCIDYCSVCVCARVRACVCACVCECGGCLRIKIMNDLKNILEFDWVSVVW